MTARKPRDTPSDIRRAVLRWDAAISNWSAKSSRASRARLVLADRALKAIAFRLRHAAALKGKR